MFERALEETRKGAPVERVLEKYDLTDEEKEMLVLASQLAARKQPRLSRDARKRILHELRKQIQTAPGGFRSRKALIIAVAMLVLTGGTFAFATSSLPSSPLYPIRTAVERAAVRVLPPGELKARLMLWTIEKQASQASDPHVRAEVKEKVLQTVEQRMDEYRTVREKLRNERKIEKFEERAKEKVERLRQQIKKKREKIENRTPEIRKRIEQKQQNSVGGNNSTRNDSPSGERGRQPSEISR